MENFFPNIQSMEIASVVASLVTQHFLARAGTCRALIGSGCPRHHQSIKTPPALWKTQAAEWHRGDAVFLMLPGFKESPHGAMTPGLLLSSFWSRNASFLQPTPGSFTCCQDTKCLFMQVIRHKPSCATAGFVPCCGSHCPS